MNPLPTRSWILIAVVLCVPIMSACGSSAKSYIRPRVDFSYIQSAAVLPFENLSRNELADERMRSVFLTEILAAQVMEIANPGETSAALNSLRISPTATLTPEQAVAIGERLSVDAVFSGVIEEYGFSGGRRDQSPEITAVFALTETETGSIIWRAQIHEAGSSFWRRLFGSSGDDIYEVSRKSVRKALGTLL